VGYWRYDSSPLGELVGRVSQRLVLVAQAFSLWPSN
jgi:hypothetical protein